MVFLSWNYTADFLLENIAVREHHESFTDSMQDQSMADAMALLISDNTNDYLEI